MENRPAISHMNLTILHTNDLHGHVDELTVLAAMARRIRSEVEAAGGYCLLVDCGDAEERSVLEDYMRQHSPVSPPSLGRIAF